MAQVRLVVVDDDPQFLRALVSLLDVEFDIVATASGGKEGVELIRHCKPDVAVLGLGKPTPNGFEILRELAKDPHCPRVVICSAETHAVIVEAARHAGAQAYVFKERMEEDLIMAVQSAYQGRFFVSGANRSGDEEEHAKFFKALGVRVRELREKAGLTQEAMVSFGFSARHWQQIEAGRPITMTTLLRICQVFRVKPDEILRGLDGDVFHD